MLLLDLVVTVEVYICVGHCEEVEVANVDFGEFTELTEDSEISYSCRSGTVQTSGERARTSTCTRDGTWDPDPKDLNCIGKLPSLPSAHAQRGV